MALIGDSGLILHSPTLIFSPPSFISFEVLYILFTLLRV
nr:MAG TPA: hypothetical protein [Caudoviricetes sp.]